MILREALKRSVLLQRRSLAGYIHMEDHDKKINPGRQQLSYNNPKYFKKDKTWINVPLGKKGRVSIEEGKFRQYKERMLDPSPDIVLEPDTESLWYGMEGEEPNHYFAQLPGRSYFKVPSIQRPQEYCFVPELLRPNPSLTASIDTANLQKYGASHLVQIAIKLRTDRNLDLKVWHNIDLLLQKKLHTLSTIQTIQLKWAFSGIPRRGLPDTHKILSDLIMGDLKDMDINQLIAAYCALKYDNVKKQALIAERIVNDPVMLNQINSSAKLMTDFLRAYAGRRSKTINIVSYKRNFNEEETRHANIISKLNAVPLIFQMPLSDVVHVLRSLFVAGIQGIHHFLLAIYSRLMKEYASLDYRQAFEVLFVSQKIDGGDFTNTQLATLLKPAFLKNWDKYTDLERIKIVYCYWNIHQWDEFKQLYSTIPISPNPSLLYYFTQIEMIDTSHRLPEVARGLFKIEYVPLPYFYRLRQFQHFIEGERQEWETTALEEKFYQSEKYFTPLHLFKSVMQQKEFIELGKFLSTIACKFTPLTVAENTELVQYALEGMFIAVEALPERDFLPTGEMKKSAMLKAKCLESMGWIYIGLRWKSFKETPRNKQLEWLKETIKKASGHQAAQIISSYKENRATIETVIDVREEHDLYPASLEELINDDWTDVVVGEEEQEQQVVDEEEERKEIEARRIRRIAGIKEALKEFQEEVKANAADD